METRLPRADLEILTAEDRFVNKQNNRLTDMEKSPKTDTQMRSIVPDTGNDGPPILARLADF